MSKVHLKALFGKEEWNVTVKPQHPKGYFYVEGKGSGLEMYLGPRLPSGILLAIPNYKLSGCIPVNMTPRDVMQYVGVDNKSDATTIAVAARWAIAQMREVSQA